MNYKVDKSEVIFKGKVFDIQIDQLTYESGNKGHRETVIHYGGAVVVPVKDDGKILMVRQFRHPFMKFLYELPAGKIDKGEDPLVCAGRELKEETGYRSDNIKALGSIYTSPGFCTEELFIYSADNLVEGDHEREEGELGMEVFEFSIDEIKRMIASGEIKDAKTICGISMYQNRV